MEWKKSGFVSIWNRIVCRKKKMKVCAIISLDSSVELCKTIVKCRFSQCQINTVLQFYPFSSTYPICRDLIVGLLDFSASRTQGFWDWLLHHLRKRANHCGFQLNLTWGRDHSWVVFLQAFLKNSCLCREKSSRLMPEVKTEESEPLCCLMAAGVTQMCAGKSRWHMGVLGFLGVDCLKTGYLIPEMMLHAQRNS